MLNTRSNARDNAILSSLSDADFGLLAASLEEVEWRRGHHLETAGREITYVCFPRSGIISVVAMSKCKRHEAEVGLIGFEGTTGLPILLGVNNAPHNVVVQVAGHGWKIVSGELRRAMQISSSIRDVLLKWRHVFSIQLSFTALAYAQGSIEQRLARWLLMADDRVEGQIALTHDLLALMLAVRRAGVTMAISQLSKAGLISHKRGVIQVLNRAGLEDKAAGLYGEPEREMRRLFDPAVLSVANATA